MRAYAINQDTSSHVAATSGVTASPSTSAMARNRLPCTTWYWAGAIPSDAYSRAIRDSRCPGSRSGSVTSAEAATEPAGATCCVPSAWSPRLEVPSSSTGRAVNRCQSKRLGRGAHRVGRSPYRAGDEFGRTVASTSA